MAMRDYRAMSPEQLARCVRELVSMKGDAYDRVAAKGEDYVAHVNAATAAADMMGISSPDLPDLEHGEEGELPTPAPTGASGLPMQASRHARALTLH